MRQRVRFRFLDKIYIYDKIKNEMLGKSIKDIYYIARSHGYQVDIQEYYRQYDNIAENVYENANLTKGIIELINLLDSQNYKIGILSSSRRNWIDIVLKRLRVSNSIDLIISLNDSSDLPGKPSPQGYLKMIELLKVKKENTIIIEDSNTGIKAAKSANVLTICLKENHLEGYIATGADIYVNRVMDLISLFNWFKV